jgi:hypothetical protein
MHSGLRTLNRHDGLLNLPDSEGDNNDAIHWPVRAVLKNKDLGSGAIVIWEISCTFPEQWPLESEKVRAFARRRLKRRRQ